MGDGSPAARLGDGAIDLAAVRRSRMRAQARSRHGAGSTDPDRFQTPEWLDRSFVLPLTKPERPRGNGVPLQSTRLRQEPAADQADTATASPPHLPIASFRRPAAPEVDFGRVIRRSDLSRALTRASIASAGVTGLALIAYLLVGSPLALGASIACALITLAAIGVRTHVTAAPVPQLPA